MYDESHIRLVDPHAKRIRRHDNLHIAAHELFLDGAAILHQHSGVIDGDRSRIARVQLLGHLVTGFPRRRIDDPATLIVRDELLQCRLLVTSPLTGLGFIVQVGPSEPRHKGPRFPQLQLVNHIGPDVVRGSGGQGNRLGVAQPLAEVPQIACNRGENHAPTR